ncbi:MAG: flagellar hook-associated protein FlgK [Planctomycetes bacterium]|nr:flagellar hook-associated protein FlgK [Planctomycetota bacterium]
MASDLSIGLSGLLVAQRALKTTGHNVANANTKGYSKQSVSLSARAPVMSTDGPVGQGVTVTEIRRIKDELLDSQIWAQTALLGSAEMQSNLLNNIQSIFNELSDSSLSNTMDKFFQSLHELSKDPVLSSNRQQLVQDGTNLVNKFNTLSEQFQKLQADAAQSIMTRVNDLNSITSEIAELNERIPATEFSGANANDISDKRDALITKLSKLADIKVQFTSRGTADILLGGTLVVFGKNTEALSTAMDGQNTAGIYGIAEINGGELKGLLNIQDVTVPKYLGKLDTLAASIIKEINNIHSEGVGLDGGFTSLTSTNAVSSATALLSSSSNNLPFTPSVTTYTTGTVTSSGSTVTGSGTTFTGNVAANDWIKLNDGNYYKVVSVDSNIQLTISGTYTDVTATATNITDGSLYVNLEDSSGGITRSSISVASDETITTLSAKLDAITNLSSSVSNGLITLTAASGYKFSFTKGLDTNPGTISNSTATLSGHYSGSDNDIYTLTVQDAGTGSIGTGSAVIRVTDLSGTVLQDLDVGANYTEGDVLQIADDVSISFGSGTIVANQTLTFDVTSDPDTSNVLTALGLNTFFKGNDASTIGVTQYIIDDPTRIAAASTSSKGDNSNVLRLAGLQNSVTTSSTTFNDFLQGAVAEFGIDTRQKKSEKEASDALLLSLENRRQEVSGVSIEEEMINIVRFQQAFQASARYINIITEVTDTLMSLR